MLRKVINEDGFMYIKNAEIVDDRQQLTGEVCNVRISTANSEAIIAALLRRAKQGDTRAIDMVFDRTEGKVTQPIDMDTDTRITLKLRTTSEG